MVQFAGGVSTLGNTAGNTGTKFGTVVLAGTNNVTLSQITGSAGVHTVQISGAAQSAQSLGVYASSQTTGQSSSSSIDARSLTLVGQGIVSVGLSAGSVLISAIAGGGGAVTLSRLQPHFGHSIVTTQFGQGSLFVQPIDVQQAVQFDRVVLPVNFSGATNSTGQYTCTLRLGIYTQNVSTLSLLHSQSATTAWTRSGTANSSNLVGPRAISFAWSTTVTAGNYFFGFVSSTSSSSANASLSNYCIVQLNSSYSGILGAGSNATQQRTLGLGRYSAATNGMPSSIGFSQLQGNSSAFVRLPAFYMTSGTV